MKKYFFVSNTYYSGKTSVILGLASNLVENGKKVGYFKPWSILSEKNEEGLLIDPNLELIKKVLGLSNPITDLYGIELVPNYLTEFAKKPKDAIKKIILEKIDKLTKENFDYFFIEGHGSPYFGMFIEVSHEILIQHVDATPIIIAGIDKYNKDDVLDSILATKDLLKTEKEILCIINKLPSDFSTEFSKTLQEELKRNKIRSIGLIPESKILAYPTVRDVFRRLQGQVIIEPDDTNGMNLIQEFLIGAMEVENALTYFRRLPSKAVITGGDRSDLVLAAIETDTVLMILSGTKYPESKVLSSLRRKNVPTLLIPYDTHTVIKQLDSITWLTPPDNDMKINEAKKLIKENIKGDIF
ncbi:MAG: DRTGG domain-containing protein [Candidatus Thorarchaeota archaeon]